MSESTEQKQEAQRRAKAFHDAYYEYSAMVDKSDPRDQNPETNYVEKTLSRVGLTARELVHGARAVIGKEASFSEVAAFCAAFSFGIEYATKKHGAGEAPILPANEEPV